MDNLVGRRLGRYEIVSVLGAGGMGKVYRAKDLELGRHVAIKVIPGVEGSESQRARRFSREIRTIAGLTHPNIVQLHDYGSFDGISYAVMELLKGKNLRQLMRGRPIPIDKALEIGIAIANGLGEAHHHGVLHRDIKPENVFLTSDGIVKILDFGLARSVAPPDPNLETETTTESLTAPGTILGTTGYQSPEQARGQDLDQRSDIFALGCVLYELLSGTNPFRRETRADTLSAILEHDPQPLTEVQPSLPPALDLIVGRCLKKDANRRFDSARDVAFALQALSDSPSESQPITTPPRRVARRAVRWSIGAAALAVIILGGYLGLRRVHPPALPVNPHVAILPFDLGEHDRDVDSIAAGLGEALALDLGLLEDQMSADFWVVPPADARSMDADGPEDMKRLFNANLVLTGTVETQDARLSLRLAAVEPSTGVTIRESTIEDDWGNVSTFQLEPIRRLANMLELEYPAVVAELIEARSTHVAAAFDAYITGRGRLIQAATPDHVAAAVGLLETAVELDPRFVAAREALSAACRRMYRSSRDRAWLDRALDQAQRGVDTLPSASSYACLGMVYQAAGRHAEAAAALEHAAELAPNSGAVRYELGAVYDTLGRSDAAEQELLLSANLRPGYWPGPQRLGYHYFSQGNQAAAANAWRQVVLSAPEYDGGYLNLGIVSHLMGRLKDARDYYLKAIELAPDRSYDAYANLGAIYFDEARFADAIEMFEMALTIDEDEPGVWGSLGYSCSYSGQPARAETAFQRAINLAEQRRTSSTDDDPGLLSDLAGYYAMVGARDTSLALLDRVIEIGSKDLRVLANIGETYEDLGERELALEWVGRAIEAGVAPGNFENKPTLSGLIDDGRYRRMIDDLNSSRESTRTAPESGSSTGATN